MIIHKCNQGSSAWLQLRAGVPTASEFSNIMTPLFKPREKEMMKTYLAEKVAETWIGGPLPGFTSWATDQGKIREDEAIPWFELETDETVDRVGFISTDDKRVGCSPDGLLGDESGIEIKCPEPAQHVKYLLAGQLPKEYAAQVHGCLYVTGRPEWKFLSYRRGFPPLLLTVKRDEAIMQKIEGILVHFLEAFDLAMDAMIKANGGDRPTPKKLYEEPAWVTEKISTTAFRS